LTLGRLAVDHQHLVRRAAAVAADEGEEGTEDEQRHEAAPATIQKLPLMIESWTRRASADE
jgi:hypothetical protein